MKTFLVVLLLSSILNASESHQHGSAPQKEPILEDLSGGTEPKQVWTCSMHPQIKQPEKGKCPICFMDLIPLDQSKVLPSDTIELNPDQQKSAGIITYPVRHDHDQKNLLLYGKVNLIPSRVIRVTAWVKGRIEKLFVTSVGERVQKGDPLYDIYSPELVAAQQELIQVRKLLTTASENTSRLLSLEANLKAIHQKLLYLGLSEVDLKKMESLQEPKIRLTIRAQYSGIVRHVAVNEGEYVKEGSPVLLLADMRELWVEASVYEDDLQTMRGDMNALIILDSHPAEEITAKLVRIDPFVDSMSRTSRAIFSIENNNQRFHEGGYARVQIETHSQKGLLIPHSAALFTGQKAVVFVKEGNAFQSRLVRILEKTQSYYRVLGNLQPGDQVVAQGTFKIDSEFQIQARDSMMSSKDLVSPYGTRLDLRSPLQRARDWMGEKSPQAGLVSMMEEMLELYLQGWESLSEDSFDDSREILEEMAGLMEKIRESSLHPHESRIMKWYEAELEKPLVKLREAKVFEDLRPAFLVHSNWLIAWIESGWLPRGDDLYKKFCPMAFDNKGAFWIQLEEEIKNPYFGSEMLACGESKNWSEK